MPAPRPRPNVVAIICGGVAAVVALFTQWASRRPEFHLSQLLNIAHTDPIASYVREVDPGFRFVTTVEHYDGLYFWAMARDPFAIGQAHDLIDLAAYRYGHPMYSWVAGVLSLGQAPLLPVVLWLMSLGSMFGAAFLLSRLVHRLGGSPWWGLAVAASPGLLYSASTVLTEPAQVALVCATLLVWSRGGRANPWLLGGLLVVTCLTKEQLVLVPVALFVDVAYRFVARGKRTAWPQLAALAAGPAALAAWLVFIRGQFTAEQLAYDSGNLGWPFVGWLGTFDMAADLRIGDFHASQIGTTTVSGLVATAVVLTIGAVAGLLRRDALGWVVLLQLGLVACLGWRTLVYPHEMFRIPSVALVLAIASIGVTLGRRTLATEVEEPATVVAA